jgi:hypothetical protein
MTHIRTRNPLGGEYSFFSREEFIRAVERGGITADWEVLHGATGRWLPISAHPAFNRAPRKTRASGAQQVRPSGEGQPKPEVHPHAATRPSSELVLIYPDPSRTPPPRDAITSPLPDDCGPVLTPHEIDRVLRPRESLRNTLPPAPAPAPEREWSTAVRPSGERAIEPEESFHVREGPPSPLPRVLLVGLVALLFLAALSAARGKQQHPSADPRAVPTRTQAPPTDRSAPTGQPATPPPAPTAPQGR